MTIDLSKRLSRFLLPHWWTYPGFLFFLLGGAGAYFLFVKNLKLEFLQIKVFAIYSQYFEKKYFSVISNDAGEEIVILMIITGLFLISFSRLRNETDETVWLRVQALFISVFINTLILLLSAILVYGIGFLAIAIANCFLILLINSIVFEILLFKQKRRNKQNGGI